MSGSIWHDGVGVSILPVGPRAAAHLLEGADPANPTDPDKVAELARRMSAGEWEFRGDTIVFSCSGVLRNGHHRLLAILASGTTQVLVLAEGAPDPKE